MSADCKSLVENELRWRYVLTNLLRYTWHLFLFQKYLKIILLLLTTFFNIILDTTFKKYMIRKRYRYNAYL